MIPQQLATLLQNPQAFNQKLNQFAQNLRQNNNGGFSPQQMVQNLLNNGSMSQTQFNTFRNIANQITGMHN